MATSTFETARLHESPEDEAVRMLEVPVRSSIMEASKRGKYECVFQVPGFIYTLPCYDKNAVARGIARYLQRFHQYETMAVDDTVKISWNKPSAVRVDVTGFIKRSKARFHHMV